MPKNLLVADDSITIRKAIGMIFSTEDVQLTAVDNGLDAISKAKELKPDLILADLSMPGKSGYEVCEAVKNNSDTQHIPVLLMAGTGEPFDESRARAVRADAHIVKPFDSQSLLDKAKTLLGGALKAEPARPAGDTYRLANAAPTTLPPQPSATAPVPQPAAPPPSSPTRGPGTPVAPAPVAQRAPLPPRPLAAVPPQPAKPASTPVPAPAAPAPPAMGRPPTAARPFPMAPMPPMSRPPPGAPMPPRPGMPPYPMGRPPGPGGPISGLPPPMAGPVPGSMPGPMPPGRPPMPGAGPAPMPGAPPRPMTFGPHPGTARPRDPFGLSGPVPAAAAPGAMPAARRPIPLHPPFVVEEALPEAKGAEEISLDMGGPPASAPQQRRSPSDGGEALLREALSKASREVIEKIAWEVVPQLAETIIREELERLMKEREGKG